MIGTHDFTYPVIPTSQFQEPAVAPTFRGVSTEISLPKYVSIFFLTRFYFTNKNASGTQVAASAMKLVVETCHYSGEKGSISHDISPTFWNKVTYIFLPVNSSVL